MSGRIAGIARIKVNGELLESIPGAEIEFGGEVVKDMKKGHRVYGPTYEVVPSKVTCSVVWKNETPIEDFRTLFQGVILFEVDNGITYKCSNMYLMGSPKAKDDSGEIDLEFQGDPAKKQ